MKHYNIQNRIVDFQVSVESLNEIHFYEIVFFSTAGHLSINGPAINRHADLSQTPGHITNHHTQSSSAPGLINSLDAEYS